MPSKNIFVPDHEIIGKMQPRSIEEIKNEPMLWSADYDFTLLNGGEITRDFLRYLNPRKRWIIDSRVHMLMKGWYPCIGGWHLDNIPRNTITGQPDYKNPPYVCDHIMAVIDVNTQSLTEFLTSKVKLSDPPKNETVYGFWSKEINKQIERGILLTKRVSSGDVIKFSSYSFHRGVPAEASGWRFFIRATTNTPQQVHNEIRKQVNTYIPIEAGW